MKLLKRLFKRKPPQVERFIIRKDREWAFIYVDEHTGVFAAYGSYGTYAYCWTHRSDRSLKQFLSGLNFDYFMGKTRPSYERFDFGESVKDIKQRILECRRDGSLDAGQAREAWDAVEELSYTSHGGEFLSEMCNSEAIMLVYRDEYYEAARVVPDGDSLGFWEKIWPEFLKAIDTQERT